jgi:hypothetical protein
MNETLRYTQLGLAVAALLAKEEPLDAGQARQYIEDGSLFSWLGRRYDGEIDLSLYEAADEADVLERFQALSDTVDTERTFGVGSSGLALLAAYCFEVLQEIHYFKKPSRAPRPRRVPVPVPADQHTRAAGDHCHGHWPT